MEKGKVIRITPVKRKPGLNQNKKKYFDKLSKNAILALINFFDEDEQIKFFTLNNKFKSAFFDINSINEKDSINNLKYMLSLNNLKKRSNGFSPYLNIFLNINIINLNPENLGVKLDENSKKKRLKIFVEKFNKETNNNKILIQINKNEDFHNYYNFLNLINKELRDKIKYDIEISKILDIKINDNKDIITKLFNLISFKKIKPFI